jgi:hypothetical protein
MKLRDVISFLTFSSVTDYATIEKQFNEHHSAYQSHFPYWSNAATRRKLISQYWYSEVFYHFGTLAGLALLLAFLTHPAHWLSATAFLLTGCLLFITFTVVLLFVYIPSFSGSYLPLLDSYIEEVTGKQLESIQKCKKQQYSVKAIVLIHHALQRLAGLKDNGLDNVYVNLLTKQYGISKQMIENAYKELFLGKWDGKPGRKYTEMVQSFEEAEDYFLQLGAGQAFPVLDSLREKVLKKAIGAAIGTRKELS